VAISGPHGGEGGGVFADINITPLTDIFLVLLIIFMVTTSVTIESAAHVDLPNATNTAPENKGVIVTYTAQHELFVNSKDVPERELQSWVSPSKPAQPKLRSRPSGSPVRN
jgi:biopolymer transport protein ExbD